jgi:hypothetical protein
MVAPPLFAGAAQETLIDVLAGAVPVTPVGATAVVAKVLAGADRAE